MTHFEQGVAVFDNTFIRNEELIAAVDKESNWTDGSLENGKKGSFVRICKFQDMDPQSDIHSELTSMFVHYINEYGKNFPNLAITKCEGLKVVKYETGGFFKQHADFKDTVRQLSAVLFLNDDFKGEGITFPIQALEIEAKPGRLVIYPSFFNYVNEIKEIKDRSCYVVQSYFK
jgi:predicted 2-oxoglutarate/Fe(II)-dependent dioxygenase YbiX